MPSKSKRKVDIESTIVGSLVDLTVTATVPTTAEVGDTITPSINVKNGVTPVSGVLVDFFVQDSLGTSELGERQTTDVSGNATASDSYYVPVPEATNTIKFIMVVQKKAL